MAFHFPLMPRIFMAVATEDRFPITDIVRQTPDIPGNCQWAIFLRNHDELTLEMVTDRERDYLWQHYAADKRMRLNLGIRRRLAPLMENDRRRMELLNGLMFSMPGTPVMYYGDEIGMGDNIFLGDRGGVRTPMQWSLDRNGGFSRAHPSPPCLPCSPCRGTASTGPCSTPPPPSTPAGAPARRRRSSARWSCPTAGRARSTATIAASSRPRCCRPACRTSVGSRARGAASRPRPLWAVPCCPGRTMAGR